MEREGQRHLTALAFFLNGRVELAEETDLALLAEAYDIAGGEALRGFHKGAPARAINAAVQCRLDGRLGAAPDAPALQSRRDHPGVINDDYVAGAQQLRQIAHRAI